MKLYEIPRNSPLRVQIEGRDGYDEAKFFHIDGMFSYCETSDKQPFHLSVMTEMELVDGAYQIK